MGLFDVTPEDVAMGTVLQPGWYETEVSTVEDKPAKTDGSAGTMVRFKVLNGIDKDGNAAGPVTVSTYFSSKAPGRVIPFATALGMVIPKEGKKGIPITQEALGGKRLGVYVKQEIYQNRPVNSVADFRPPAS